MKLFNIIYNFFEALYRNKSAVYQLIKRDYKNRYVGSNLGVIWNIIQPLVMILVLWFVFTKGFKVGLVRGNIPFIAWLTMGLIPWNFFAEALSGSTAVFQEYSYLVKKIHFRITILPVVKLFSSFITHIVFLVLGIIILLTNGINFSLFWFQGLYYMFAMMVLIMGVSWITSSLQVFIKDISQIVSIVLQFGFWLTPIFWDLTLLPGKYQFLMKLNPMFYIVDGYKKSFIYDQPFWEEPNLTIYYWSFTVAVLIISIILIKKLKPHFADVL